TASNNPEIGLKLLNLDPRDHPEVMDVQSGSPAQAAGMKTHDVVLSFAGVPVASVQQLINLIHQRGGKVTQLTVRRGPDEIPLSITPAAESVDGGHIGAVLGSSTTQVYVVQKPGPTPWEQV